MRNLKNIFAIAIIIALIINFSCNTVKNSTEIKNEKEELPTVDTDYYNMVETPAVFQTEQYKSFNDYLIKSVKYPPLAIKKKQQGTVIVQFGVDWYGKTKIFAVLKKSGYDILDKAVISAIESSPNWQAAKIKNMSVGQLFIIKVKFNLAKKRIETPVFL